MPSLSEITGLPDKILREKLKLVPHHRFDANEADNLVFMSPTVLLNDEELRLGGTGEVGAKEFLSLVTKKILEEDNPKFFEVPEITATHMGYGRKSLNKESTKAIEDSGAKFWMSKLTAVKKGKKVPGADMPNPNLRDDRHAFEDSYCEANPDEDKENRFWVNENMSGLEIKVKGSYLMFFSILLMFFGSKSKKRASDPGNIGPNKVSDFLVFWTLPFLLKFSSSKLSDIKRHYKFEEGQDFDNDSTVEITTKEVIENACEGINESAEFVENLLEVYRDLLGSEAIEQRYEVLASQDGSPIIFIPLKYQETKLPVDLKYLGKRKTWSELGEETLTKEFLNKFVKNKQIQKDVFLSMEDVGKFQGIEYGVILPDHDTYKIFIKELDSKSKDYLTRRPERFCGRGIVDVPQCAVVEEKKGKTTISFSYMPESRSTENVAALVYALGSQYIDHVTIAILHGKVLNNKDPDYVIGNIHPVNEVEQLVQESGQLVRSSRSNNPDAHVMNFLNIIPKFSEHNFPKTFSSWEKEVRSIDIVRDAKLRPQYKSQVQLNCLFHETKIPSKLHKNVLLKIQYSEEPERYTFRVVNPNGCAIKFLVNSLGRNRMSLLIALKDYAGLENEPKRYSRILQQVVKHFLMAIVTAGLPEVFPVTSQTNQETPSTSGAGDNVRSTPPVDANNPGKSGEQDPQEKTKKKKKKKRKRKHESYEENSDGSTKRKKSACSSDRQVALNVMLVCSEWSSSKGGIPTFNRELAVNLAKFCPTFNVYCYVTEGGQKEQDDAKSKNVKLITAEPIPENNDTFAPLHVLPNELQNPDIVISHGRKFGSAGRDLRESVTGCKWIHFVHVDCEQMGKYKDGEAAIDENEEKDKDELEFCKQANLVVAVGTKLQEKYRRSLTNYDQVTVDVIIPGLCDEFVNVRRPDEAETKETPFRVYVFGRGSNEDFRLKGYDIAANAVAKLPSNFSLFSVGAPKGQQKEVTNRFLNETSIKQGKLTVRRYCNDRKQLKDLFSQADMIVMPSREEAFGMIGLEAISAGIPVLVSRRSGLAEALKVLPLVGDSCIVDLNDDDHDDHLWSEKVRSSWSLSKTQRNEQAKEVRKQYDAKYKWSTACKELEDKLRKIVGVE